MNELVRRTVLSAASRIFPLMTAMVASLVGLIAVPAPDYSHIAPAFTLIAVYCWSIWRPDLMPLLAVFLIGVFEDMIRGLPLGVTALVLLTAAIFAQNWRGLVLERSWKRFLSTFCRVVLLCMAIEWLAMSILIGDLLDPTAALLRYLLTMLLLPVGTAILLTIRRVGIRDI
ncbi:MAG: rod shape-determining protein MreD [Rhodospirillaceae bacterium]|nr:rod shape-determining protein MreD [Rhodospirillaceae bacterium]MCY4237383.1 rod shape-determining protein MreD [Rhodospirillaceae bacterium]